MPFEITKPGIYTEFPVPDYYADPCLEPSLTQSLIKLGIERSMAHVFLEHPRLAPPEEEEVAEKYVAATAIGDAAHALATGRSRDLVVGPFDNWTSKDARAF